MPHLALTVLGPFRATLDGREVAGFGYAQVKALLAYLALEADRPHHREVLGELLWPDRPPDVSRSLVRRALATLRQAIGDQHADPPFLLVTRDTVQFNPSSNHHLDLGTFTSLLSSSDRHGHPDGQLCAACVSAIEQATARYQGAFLPHLALQTSPAFGAWIQRTHDQVQRQAVSALALLAATYTQQGQWAQVQRIARRQLELEPWDEAAQRTLLSAYAAQGNRSAALAQYERYRRLLQDDLGSAPDAETTALYQAIRNGFAAPTAEPPPTPQAGLTLPSPATPLPTLEVRPTLPAPATPLVDRAQELAVLRERLADPHCRLITITGGSGVGKTHLALTVAHASAPGFRDGVAFVSLAAVTDPILVAPTIWRKLGMALEVTRDAEAALLAHLHTREILLLLDNLEHLLASAPLIAAISAHAPAVKLLVTSQVPLAVQAEWLITLDGLDYPDAATTDRLDTFPAVQLFLQRARQVAPDLSLADGSLPAIAQICRHLGGLPLGIELAANWVRTLACAEIADALQQSLAMLSSAAPDLPPRHRSLQAVLDAICVRLDPGTLAVYRRLAVFQGGCTWAAAEQVAQAAPADLQALIAASLLRRHTSGRYSMQAFVRQDAAIRLASDPAEHAAVAARHARFFGSWLTAQHHPLQSSVQLEILGQIDAELPNIRAAWQWMLDHRQLDLFAGGVFCLYRYHDMRGWLGEVRQLLGAAVAVFGADPMPDTLASGQARPLIREPDSAALAAEYLGSYGWALIRLGQLGAAQRALERGLAMLEQAGQRRTGHAALTLMGLGISLLWQEQPQTAWPLLAEAARYAERGTDTFMIAMSQFVLGVFHTCTAQYAHARPHFVNALRNIQRLGDLHGTALTLWWLGDMARMQGDAIAARGYYMEGVALARPTGLLSALAHYLYGLGELDCQGGAWPGAQQAYTESLQIFEAIGEGRDIALARLGLARVAFALGQHPTCHQQLSAAAEAVERIDTLAGRVQVLRRLVEVLSQVGRTQLSARLDAALEQHGSRAVGVTQAQEARSLDLVLGELSLGRLSG